MNEKVNCCVLIINTQNGLNFQVINFTWKENENVIIYK